jgi:hypothetical protein
VDIIHYVAWPVVALSILFVLRRPLTELIDRLKEYEGSHGTLRFGETKAPASQPLGAKEIPPLSGEARKTLATLWERQTFHFKEDYSRRWSFRVLPCAPGYGLFMIGFAELLNLGLVTWTEKDGQAVLSNAGIEYMKKHPDIQGSTDRYSF